MIDRNELKAQIENLTDKQAAIAYGAFKMIQRGTPATVDEFPEALLSLTLDEKKKLLRMLEENGIPAARAKSAAGKPSRGTEGM